MDAAAREDFRVLIEDISKGQENVKIPLVIGLRLVSPELPKFTYMKNNMVYQAAHVDFSLARISVCCRKCRPDCLSVDIPCSCAAETRGVFAYTTKGLLKESFLNDYLQNPERQHMYYCETCPLRRNAQDDGCNVKPCEGHPSRKFIKECWYRCGCNKKKCGNRVVQRGIQANLQVFLTPDGKGWGVRTLDALKRGTFVCEYIGEIVTNDELYDRNKERAAKNERHTYPVLLEADWASERILTDKEALCLDATEFGNVGRFINHRCSDANLIEIPVEIETPDHHYYHVAFFTVRDVKPWEELTWDYNIFFDDVYHPIKAFTCVCGSLFCRQPLSNARRK